MTPPLLKHLLRPFSRRKEAALPPELRSVQDGYPFLAVLTPAERARLGTLVLGFLSEVAINGAAGLTVTDAMRLAIASQACLPVLELGLNAYPRFAEIVVYPGEFAVPRREVDAAGVVHEFEEALAGEAWQGGPVVLSWEAAATAASALLPCNVVIHEFAHQLDMTNGALDGVPLLSRQLHPGLDARRFETRLQHSYDAYVEALDRLEASFPRWLDPDSKEALGRYAALVLDAYGATDLPEYFSVASEAFFTDPGRLAARDADLYDLLRAYFRQDPARRLTDAGRR